MAYHRDVRPRHQDRAHLQHLRPAPRGRATGGSCRTSSSRRCDGKPLTVYGDGTQTRSFCYVDDEVAGLLALLESDHVGPMNIGNPDEFTMLELAELVLEVTGAELRDRVRAAARSTTRSSAGPTSRLAEQVLGWQPEVDLREGLARTLRLVPEESVTAA